MDDYVLDARVEHVRNFVHILTAVKLSRKQHARVSVLYTTTCSSTLASACLQKNAIRT